jgi:rubrerythrin
MIDSIVNGYKTISEKYKKENEQLKARVAELEFIEIRYNGLIKAGLVCEKCGGAGFVGSPPDDYYDCPECKRANDKFEAFIIEKYNEFLLNKYRLQLNDHGKEFLKRSES